MLDKAGVPCPEDALPSLLEYVNMLMRWNARMNLVGARTWEEAVEDLIADCLRLKDFLETLPLADDPVSWDPGAGAGLPGIPLRCVWNKGTYHMIEVRSKRALFLSQVLGTIDLARTYVHNEDINKFMRGKKGLFALGKGAGTCGGKSCGEWPCGLHEPHGSCKRRACGAQNALHAGCGHKLPESLRHAYPVDCEEGVRKPLLYFSKIIIYFKNRD